MVTIVAHLTDSLISHLDHTHLMQQGQQNYFDSAHYNQNTPLIYQNISYMDHTPPEDHFNYNQIITNYSNSWSERILQDITGLLYVLSPTGKVLYCSSSCIELTGYLPEELIGRTLTDFIHMDDLDIFIHNFQTAFSTMSRIKVHYRIQCKNNTFLLLESMGYPKQSMPNEPPNYLYSIAQPYLSRSNGLMDSFMEIKTENELLKKQLSELQAERENNKYHSSPSSIVDQSLQQYQQFSLQHSQPYNQQQMFVNGYPSSSYPNDSNSKMITINDSNHNQHQQHNFNSQTTALRRPSNSSSLNALPTNSMGSLDDNNSNTKSHWNHQYTPSVTSSVDINDMMARCQQEEKTLENTAGLTTATYLSPGNNNSLSALNVVRKDKWKRRKKAREVEYLCTDCGTTASPEWRKGPHGPKTLCNACGLRWAKKNKKI